MNFGCGYGVTRTIEQSRVYHLVGNRYKKKTATIKLLSRLVNPPGFEPGTPTLKVLCSTY